MKIKENKTHQRVNIDLFEKHYSELNNNKYGNENLKDLISAIFSKNYKKYLKPKARKKLLEWARKEKIIPYK